MMSNLQPADFFVLRTPALSWDVVRRWSDGLTATRTDLADEDLERAVADDERLLRARLREMVRRPEVQEAIYVASPSLYIGMQPWLDGDDSPKAKSVEPAIVRYLVRMAGRATPFGLFAGYSLGVAAERTDLIVPARSSCTRQTRLNVDIIYALAVALANRSEYRPYLRYRANATVYTLGQRIRYYVVRIDASSESKIARKYSIREAAANSFTEAALRAARTAEGATIVEIAQALSASSDGVGESEAREYVSALVDAELFCPTLLPPVTGVDPAHHLLAELRRLPNASSDAALLAAALDDLAELDALDVHEGRGRSLCERIEATLRALGAQVETGTLLKVDLRKPAAKPLLKKSVLREIAAAAQTIAKMIPNRESPLRAFAAAVEERYQSREVPLLEVLDPEAGIGFEQTESDMSSLIQGLKFEKPADSFEWRERDAFMLVKLSDALRERRTEIQLSDEDVAALATPDARPLPPGQTLLVSVAASSVAALERDEYQVNVTCGGFSTSSALLGRFLSDDAELEAHVRAALRCEEAHCDEAIHAEIAHHLEGPVGPAKPATNISRRPILREYEIDVVNASGAPADRKIGLDDLTLSARGGTLILRSRSLGRRVIPHLSTAHSFSQPGAAVYRLLAQLQLAEVDPAVPWSWGPALSRAPFLPRVTYGKLVLALATWQLPGKTFAAIGKLRGAARVRALHRLRIERQIPRHVCLVDGDNLLQVDLDNVLSVESMLTASKGLRSVVLREPFLTADNLIAHGPDGAFCHEMIVSLMRPAAPSISRAEDAALARVAGPTPHRNELPGGNWLFAKLYCGMATAERLLSDAVVPLVEELRGSGALQHWFYVRYADPHRHLRLRFSGDPKALWTEVVTRLLAAASSMRPQLHKVVIDTYEPEVERYGGEAALSIAHEIFECDSDAAARIVAAFRCDANARWRMALLSMDALLEDLSLPLETKREVVARARETWVRALRATPETVRQLGDNFRRQRGELERLLRSPPPVFEDCVRQLRHRSVVIGRAASKLRALTDRGHLSTPIPELATSYLHMAANRILRSSANKHELALYDILFRIYDGSVARTRQSGRMNASDGRAALVAPGEVSAVQS